MNYELAKHLKDAGFPMQAASMEDGNDSKRKHQIFRYGKDDFGRDGAWHYPTLSELIEACGIHFYSLTNNLNHKWTVNEESGKEFIGSTPEEAVAHLWLALHNST
jgi:hypothetical protein